MLINSLAAMNSMKTKITKYVGTFFLMSSLVLMGQSCTKGGNRAAQDAFRPITLEYWTVFNSPDDYRQVIEDYTALHPNIRINVKKFRFDEYEEQLVNALAEDRGPDLFSVHNSWVPGYRSKLLPLPPTTTLASQFTVGSIKKEVVTELRTTRSLNQVDLRTNFLEQVYNDVYLRDVGFDEDGDIVEGELQIFGLPIAFDSMVTYFNRDLLDNAGISQPSKFWHEFQEDVQQLARFDSQGNIIAAGAALGTANNIPRAVDILSILMMQNGAVMIDDDRDVIFDDIPDELRGTRSTIPGEEALRFYVSFANENNRNFTWGQDEIDAFEAFLQGKVSYFFGYHYHKEQIEGLAPKLNFGVAPFPQIQGNPEIYYANYWVEGVSKKTRNPDAAWDFVQFMTSAGEAQKFLEASNKPTARRDLLDAQAENPELEVYINQLLKSKSWYNGQDPAAMESIMNTLIQNMLDGAGDIDDLIKLASDRVQQTLRF